MNEMAYLLPTFGLSLGLTLVLEGMIALLFRMRGRDLLLFLLSNMLTNPAVVCLDMVFRSIFPDISVFLWQLPLEGGVVAMEGYLYARRSRSLYAPWLFSAVANSFSYGMGLIVSMLFLQ